MLQLGVRGASGSNHAREHPAVVSAVMISASLDWAATTIAAALVAEEEETVPHNNPQNPPAFVGRERLPPAPKP